ncbi:MAG TPA: diaminopimelate epimerase [Bacteroidetes bacterium]|nr:diaminopimelate epimerase [Bacteroidota bacterium]
MKIEFAKMSGAGNDFVVIDNRSGKIRNVKSLARRLCDRRWGVGADGLLLLEKSNKGDYRMMYYNADGSYGGMCGNGGRCIAYFAFRNEIAGTVQRFEALNHIYIARIKRNDVVLEMKNPRNLRTAFMLPIGKKRLKANYVDTGSPHVVILVSDVARNVSIEELDVVQFGRQVRHHDMFAPKGTNVNFVELGENNLLKIRTYERGVENETLACGTGSVASAIVASELLKLNPPIRIEPRSKSLLSVDFARSDRGICDVTLTGGAEVVFTGSIVL